MRTREMMRPINSRGMTDLMRTREMTSLINSRGKMNSQKMWTKIRLIRINYSKRPQGHLKLKLFLYGRHFIRDQEGRSGCKNNRNPNFEVAIRLVSVVGAGVNGYLTGIENNG